MPRRPRVSAEPPDPGAAGSSWGAPGVPVDPMLEGGVGEVPGEGSHGSPGDGGRHIPSTPVPPPFPPPVPVAAPGSWPAPDAGTLASDTAPDSRPAPDAGTLAGDTAPGSWPAPDAGTLAGDESVETAHDDAIHEGAVRQLRSALEDLEEILHVEEPVVVESPEVGSPGAAEPVPTTAHGSSVAPLADHESGDVAADDGSGLADLFEDWPPATETEEYTWAGTTRVGSEIGTYSPPVVRRIDYGRVGDLVDRITGYIGNRPQLAQRVSSFQLTRDPRLDADQRSELERIVTRELQDVVLPVTAAELPEVLDVVYDELIGLGPLGVVWRDPAVTEILVDGWDNIYVEVGGKLQTTAYRFRSADHAAGVARGLAERVSGRSLSPTNSLVTAELPAARVNFAYKPVVRSGLAITLRKLDGVMGMAKLLEYRSLTEEMAQFLAECVSSRAAVLVSGGTGVGKTTLLNALSESIGPSERVVTIEDSYELRLANRFVVSMQTKEAASGDDTIFVTQDQLLRNSLRMRPDRIVVGEMRDGEAAAVMLAAANTGHEGTMTTIHANSADSAVNVRLTNMARAGADVPTDVARWEIAEVTAAGLDQGGRIQLRPLFRAIMHPDAPVEFVHVGGIDPDGRLAQRLQASGFDPERWFP